MKDVGIYLITNTVNGRRYVGSATSFKKRWRLHEVQLQEGRHHSRYLQRAWNKYGAGAFTFRPIIYCAKHDLIMYEQAAMDALKPEYNIVPTAGSMLGYRHTEETRKKMSIARRRNPSSPRKGMKHTEESRRKISESRKGKGLGRRPPETGGKISAALKGRTLSEDRKKQISAKLMGHKQSQETIEKRAKKLRGRKMPPGFAEAVSKRMMGVKHPPEVIEKMARSKSRLSDDQVRSIRMGLIAGEKQKFLAIQFGIDPSVISLIKSGTAYRWVI